MNEFTARNTSRSAYHQVVHPQAIRAVVLVGFVLTAGIVGYGQENTSDQRPVNSILTIQQTGSDASLRGLSVVDDKVVWASGAGGEVLRTADGGATWNSVAVETADELDFRDIHAFSADEAIVISAGSPAHVYRTANAGQTWSLVYENRHQRIFFDAMEFWDRQRGIAFSDPIEGRLVLIRSENGGRSWTEIDAAACPQALAGEAGFAASGTCLAARPGGHVWIGLGGPHSVGAENTPTARVLRSTDFGVNWSVGRTPMPSAEASGVFSLAMATDQIGVAVGGNYQNPEVASGNVACTTDGGKSWLPPAGDGPRGYRSGVAVFRHDGRRMFVAVGTSGCDYSIDDGDNWQPLCENALHAVAFAGDGSAGWGSGAAGTIARFDVGRLAVMLPAY